MVQIQIVWVLCNIKMKLLLTLVLLGAVTAQPNFFYNAYPRVNPLLDYTYTYTGGSKYQQVCVSRTSRCTRELRQVCGKKSDGSVSTYNNKCNACSDPNVISFSQGRCPSSGFQPPVANVSGPVAACLGRPVVCPLILAPVCGKLSNGGFKNYSSNCSACASLDGVVGYWRGSCPAGATRPPSTPAGVKCTSRSKVCTFIYMPVCGQRNDGSSQTYPSDCTACSNEDVASYIPGGPCPGDAQQEGPSVTPVPNSVVCTSRSPICTREYFPVCGTKIGGTAQEYSNKCVACADSNVISYVTGGCSSSSAGPSADSLGPSIDSAPARPLLSNCKSRSLGCPFNIAPVCGRNIFGEETTYDNECLACSNKSTVGVYQGSCINSKPAPSVPQAPAGSALKNCQSSQPNCPFILNPVCGKTVTGTWTQYDNSCVACQNKLLAGYLEGKCPKPARPLLQNCPSRNQICGYDLNPVCGRTITGEQRTYENACLACQNNLLAGFYPGRC